MITPIELMRVVGLALTDGQVEMLHAAFTALNREAAVALVRGARADYGVCAPVLLALEGARLKEEDGADLINGIQVKAIGAMFNPTDVKATAAQIRSATGVSEKAADEIAETATQASITAFELREVLQAVGTAFTMAGSALTLGPLGIMAAGGTSNYLLGKLFDWYATSGRAFGLAEAISIGASLRTRMGVMALNAYQSAYMPNAAATKEEVDWGRKADAIARAVGRALVQGMGAGTVGRALPMQLALPAAVGANLLLDAGEAGGPDGELAISSAIEDVLYANALANRAGTFLPNTYQQRGREMEIGGPWEDVMTTVSSLAPLANAVVPGLGSAVSALTAPGGPINKGSDAASASPQNVAKAQRAAETLIAGARSGSLRSPTGALDPDLVGRTLIAAWGG